MTVDRRQVVRCVVLFGLLGLFQATLGPLIPVVRDDNGLTAATAGLLVSGFFAGSMASIATGGVLPERWARRYLVVVPGALLVAGCAGLAVRGPWPLPLVAAVVAGVGFGALVLVVNTAMAGQAGRRGVTLANLVNGAFSLGAVAGPALVGGTRGIGYPVLFAGLAVAVLLALPSRELGAVAGRRDTTEHAGRPGSVLLLFCGLMFCYAGLETGLSSWETVHLEAHGYDPGAASALTSLFWLGMAVTRLLTPLLAAVRSAPAIIAGVLSAAFAALALVALPGVAPFGYLLAGMLAGPVFPTALAWNAATLPNPRRGNAAVITASMVGNVAFPAAIGYTMQATSELLLPALVAVPVAAALAIAVLLRYRARASTPDSARRGAS
ncbi:MAG TPA: MFS transporter [Actinophytocola sp.]|uniref:MFS transporter n=1 Tax=Actinophytocola sp. TaxID=1872138 RepID=UPI002F95511E